jgi:hypothetical protein
MGRGTIGTGPTGAVGAAVAVNGLTHRFETPNGALTVLDALDLSVDAGGYVGAHRALGRREEHVALGARRARASPTRSGQRRRRDGATRVLVAATDDVVARVAAAAGVTVVVVAGTRVSPDDHRAVATRVRERAAGREALSTRA